MVIDDRGITSWCHNVFHMSQIAIGKFNTYINKIVRKLWEFWLTSNIYFGWQYLYFLASRIVGRWALRCAKQLTICRSEINRQQFGTSEIKWFASFLIWNPNQELPVSFYVNVGHTKIVCKLMYINFKCTNVLLNVSIQNLSLLSVTLK